MISRPGLSPILSISVLSHSKWFSSTLSCFIPSQFWFPNLSFPNSQNMCISFPSIVITQLVFLFSSGVTICWAYSLIRQVYIVIPLPLKCVSYYGNLFVSSLTLIHLHPMQSRFLLRGPLFHQNVWNTFPPSGCHVKVQPSPVRCTNPFRSVTWQTAVVSTKAFFSNKTRLYSYPILMLPFLSHQLPV